MQAELIKIFRLRLGSLTSASFSWVHFKQQRQWKLTPITPVTHRGAILVLAAHRNPAHAGLLSLQPI